MKRGTDVIVVGGGAIGLSVAWELAQQGVSVRVLDRGRCGREASWAGAGMIIPGNTLKAATPESRLRAISYELWPTISEKLLGATGVDNEFRRCGGLEVRFDANDAALATEIEQWRGEGVDVEPLSQRDMTLVESNINPGLASGYLLPGMAQVRNPRYLRALQIACEELGVRFEEESPMQELQTEGDRVTGVITEAGTFSAGQVCICAGAWTRQVLEKSQFSFEITPIRGQMVMLKASPLPFQHIIQIGRRYVVPRSDGRALIGSTEENVGFEKRTTAAGIGSLIDFAISMVPQLADATIERTWSGLRPGSPHGIPYLGQVEKHPNLFVAAGHYRSGLQNSPGTGRFLRELILGQPTCLDPVDFGPTAQPSALAAS